MKCHYEVLNIPRDADDATIKSSYRKLALKLHPDKNLDNPDTVKEFQLVQQAYEVLSDRNERAWYDQHRDNILYGLQSDSEYADKSLNIFPYFTTSCYSGFTDDVGGFYAVYRGIFDQIALEDMEFMSKAEFCDIPKFGDSLSDYDRIVAKFYDYWMSYVTKKTYAWLDPHDLNNIPRHAVKIAEKENNKVRVQARKERNEEVRSLVKFVRKRDKRVQRYLKLLEARTLANREKQLAANKEKRLKALEELQKAEQPEWAKFDNVKSELEQIEKSLVEQFGEVVSNSSEDDEVDDDHLYCIACNKVFKTAKAFGNHELSKKHRDNVEAIRMSMLEEEDAQEIEDEEDISDLEDEEVEEVVKEKKKKKKKRNVLSVDVSPRLESTDDEQINIESTLIEEATENVVEPVLESSNGIVECESVLTKAKASRRKNKKPPEKKSNDEDEESTGRFGRKTKKDKKRNMKDKEINRDHTCASCKSNFASKNKLFDHLEKMGHGVALTSSQKDCRKSTALSRSLLVTSWCYSKLDGAGVLTEPYNCWFTSYCYSKLDGVNVFTDLCIWLVTS